MIRHLVVTLTCILLLFVPRACDSTLECTPGFAWDVSTHSCIRCPPGFVSLGGWGNQSVCLPCPESRVEINRTQCVSCESALRPGTSLCMTRRTRTVAGIPCASGYPSPHNSTASFNATDVRLSSIRALVRDRVGNMYIASCEIICQVYRVSANGSLTIFVNRAGWGEVPYFPGNLLGDNGPAWNASIRIISDMKFDANEDYLYLAETDAHRVRRIHMRTGIIEPFAGVGGVRQDMNNGHIATNASLAFPRALAFDRSGNLYIADTSHHCIRKVDIHTRIISVFAGVTHDIPPELQLVYEADGRPALNTTFHAPYGIGFDSSGRFYVLSSRNVLHEATVGIVRVLELQSGVYYARRIAGGGQLFRDLYGPHPFNVPAKSLYIASTTKITVNFLGDIYLIESRQHRVSVYESRTGNVTTIFGRNGLITNCMNQARTEGIATQQYALSPQAVFFDPKYPLSLYVAEFNRRTVRQLYFECPRGFFIENNICQQCIDGTISPPVVGMSCYPCPAGTFARDRIACEPCPAGSISPGHVVSCSACPVWQFEVNRTHCLDTPLAIPPIPVIVDSLSIPIDPLSLRVFIRSSSAVPLVDLYEVQISQTSDFSNIRETKNTDVLVRGTQLNVLRNVTFSGLSLGITYYFRARAVNAFSASLFSNISSQLISYAPLTPVIFSIVQLTNNTFYADLELSFSNGAPFLSVEFEVARDEAFSLLVLSNAISFSQSSPVFRFFGNISDSEDVDRTLFIRGRTRNHRGFSEYSPIRSFYILRNPRPTIFGSISVSRTSRAVHRALIVIQQPMNADGSFPNPVTLTLSIRPNATLPDSIRPIFSNSFKESSTISQKFQSLSHLNKVFGIELLESEGFQFFQTIEEPAEIIDLSPSIQDSLLPFLFPSIPVPSDRILRVSLGRSANRESGNLPVFDFTNLIVECPCVVMMESDAASPAGSTQTRFPIYGILAPRRNSSFAERPNEDDSPGRGNSRNISPESSLFGNTVVLVSVIGSVVLLLIFILILCCCRKSNKSDTLEDRGEVDRIDILRRRIISLKKKHFSERYAVLQDADNHNELDLAAKRSPSHASVSHECTQEPEHRGSSDVSVSHSHAIRPSTGTFRSADARTASHVSQRIEMSPSLLENKRVASKSESRVSFHFNSADIPSAKEFKMEHSDSQELMLLPTTESVREYSPVNSDSFASSNHLIPLSLALENSPSLASRSEHPRKESNSLPLCEQEPDVGESGSALDLL